MAHGVFVDGVWHTEWYDTKATGGRFVPAEPVFRNWVTADGSPGPSGEGGFAAEPGRYHLYVSLACPWAHRTVIFRKLKKLEDAISMSIVDPVMGEQGWEFGAEPRHDRRHGQRQAASRARSTCSPIRATPAASPCRCCGTRSAAPSSTTSRRRSSACSIRRSTRSPTIAPTIIRPSCAREIDAHQRARLSRRQQRRLSRRLRHRAGSLRGGVPRRVRGARLDRGAAVAPALSRRRTR